MSNSGQSGDCCYLIGIYRTNTPFTQSQQPLCLPSVTLNWPDRHRRLNGCWMVTLVSQRWHTGCSHNAMDTKVTIKFWACSKQSHKGHWGGWLLKGLSNEAERRQTHCGDWIIAAQWLTNGCHVINAYCCKSDSLSPGDSSVFLLPPLHLLWLTNSVHWTMTVATTASPFGDHSYPWATILQWFCLFSTFFVQLIVPPWPVYKRGVFQGRHTGHWSSHPETRFFGFEQPWASQSFFLLLKCGTKVEALCEGGLTNWRQLFCIVTFIMAI